MSDLQYTEQRENALFASWKFDNSEEDYNAIIEVLNKEFRSFGEGLACTLEQKAKKRIEDPALYLEELCEAAGVSIQEIGSRNTIKTWFAGGARPKKGEASRKKLFAFAFALKLNPTETAELFHKVYLDRAFNHRSYNELIYYYCLNNGLSFAHAEELIKRVSFCLDANAGQTVMTSYIAEEAALLHSDLELMEFIQANGHNFAINSRSAKEALLRIKQLALSAAQEEQFSSGADSLSYRRDRTSDSFLYTIITERSVAGPRGTITLPFQNTVFPKEIKTNFPQVKSLSGESNSFEELRKTIILLFSYFFWRKAFSSNLTDYYDDYCDQLNDLLFRSQLPELYYGNPFDWMFLYCTFVGAERALDVFRGILSEVLDEKDSLSV